MTLVMIVAKIPTISTPDSHLEDTRLVILLCFIVTTVPNRAMHWRCARHLLVSEDSVAANRVLTRHTYAALDVGATGTETVPLLLPTVTFMIPTTILLSPNPGANNLY
jgi:hypothetical protein